MYELPPNYLTCFANPTVEQRNDFIERLNPSPGMNLKYAVAGADYSRQRAARNLRVWLPLITDQPCPPPPPVDDEKVEISAFT